MGDQSWPESGAAFRAMQGSSIAYQEDGEDDDAAEDDDPAEGDDSDRCSSGDDWIASGNLNCGTLVRAGSDKGIGDADDAEHSKQPAYSGPLERSAGRMAANDA